MFGNSEMSEDVIPIFFDIISATLFGNAMNDHRGPTPNFTPIPWLPFALLLLPLQLSTPSKHKAPPPPPAGKIQFPSQT